MFSVYFKFSRKPACLKTYKDFRLSHTRSDFSGCFYFYLVKKILFEFRGISCDKLDSFSWNFWKSGQPCEVYRNFQKFLALNFCLILLSSYFCDWMVCFLGMQQFPGFLENFARKCPYHFSHFKIFCFFHWVESTLNNPETKTADTCTL